MEITHIEYVIFEEDNDFLIHFENHRIYYGSYDNSDNLISLQPYNDVKFNRDNIFDEIKEYFKNLNIEVVYIIGQIN